MTVDWIFLFRFETLNGEQRAQYESPFHPKVDLIEAKKVYSYQLVNVLLNIS